MVKLNKKRPYFSTVHVTLEEGSTNAAWEELWRRIFEHIFPAHDSNKDAVDHQGDYRYERN